MAANADAAELFVVRVVPLLCSSNEVDVVVDVVVVIEATPIRRRSTSRVRCKPFDTAFVDIDAEFEVVFDTADLSTDSKSDKRKRRLVFLSIQAVVRKQR